MTDEHPEEIVPDWNLIAWVPPPDASTATLSAAIKDLQHLALALRETLIGLEAERGVLQGKIAQLDESRIGKAMTRIDRLEEEREVLLHRLRLSRFGGEGNEEILALKRSATWRAGRILITPLAVLKRMVGRR